jgi:hypothetical protein
MSDPEQKGKRKILHAASLTQELIDELAADLEDGWFFDPWLNPPGHPIIVASESSFAGFYWVLVKGSPEQIAELSPFVELPAVEEESEFKPYGLETMFISHGEKDSSGAPKKPPKGFVIMLKDHIYAKGTVYTLRPSEEETSLKASQPTSSP